MRFGTFGLKVLYEFRTVSKVQGLISVYVRQMMYSEKRAEEASECFLLLSPTSQTSSGSVPNVQLELKTEV